MPATNNQVPSEPEDYDYNVISPRRLDKLICHFVSWICVDFARRTRARVWLTTQAAASFEQTILAGGVTNPVPDGLTAGQRIAKEFEAAIAMNHGPNYPVRLLAASFGERSAQSKRSVPAKCFWSVFMMAMHELRLARADIAEMKTLPKNRKTRWQKVSSRNPENDYEKKHRERMKKKKSPAKR